MTYTKSWSENLRGAPNLDGHGLHLLHASYGAYIGSLIHAFTSQHPISPALIAWHGHTIFHDPQHGATCQIGDAAAIVAQTGRHVVSQFRNIDVALGGQGAPLAPLADIHLLEHADFYLNLGGICNISFRTVDNEFQSFDISPCNQIFNTLANKVGREFDEDGRIASLGHCNQKLLESLNDLPYYDATYPKSIDNNWIRTSVLPMIEAVDDSIENKMRTSVVHVAHQISKVIKQQLNGRNSGKILITGGGTYNKVLISQIRECLAESHVQFILPDQKMIEFKEAAMMALMGFLYINGIDNVLHKVTGASRTHIGGCLHQGWKSELKFYG